MKTKHVVMAVAAIGYLLAIATVIRYETKIAEKAIESVSCTPNTGVSE